MSRIAYFIFVLPLSYLPLGVLYLFTDFFYLIIVTLVPYRKGVIEKNLKNSFSDLNDKQIKKLRNKFYRHFTDLLAEGVKNLSISEKELKKRFKVKDDAIMKNLYNQNKSVLLVSGHYNNWEWLITAQNFLFDHQAYGIGMPMTSKFWDSKVNAKRQRFGMRVIHSKNYKAELLKDTQEPKAVLVLSDQSPGNSLKSYWTKFLNQDTAVLFGTEMMAHELDFAVVNFITKKIKRGYYEMELELIANQPRKCKWGEITESHTKLLERAIIETPENWLWSHKRWKREVPENLEKLKEEQHAKFKARFNY